MKANVISGIINDENCVWLKLHAEDNTIKALKEWQTQLDKDIEVISSYFGNKPAEYKQFIGKSTFLRDTQGLYGILIIGEDQAHLIVLKGHKDFTVYYDLLFQFIEFPEPPSSDFAIEK